MSITLDNLKTAKTAELLAFYNKHRTPIVKFRDRATAETRVTALLQELASKTSNLAHLNANPVAAAVTSPTVVAKPKGRTVLVFFRDHSGSMSSRTDAAKKDYNNTLLASQQASKANDIRTDVTVYEVGGGFGRREVMVPISDMVPLAKYSAPGHDTPLFRAIEDAMDFCERLPDANDPETVFLFCATTDDQDNVTGTHGGQRLAQRINRLQSTDRWTVVFRVPQGYKRSLVSMGIDAGNIMEWELSSRGLEAASVVQSASMSQFYTNRAAGTKSTRTFYTSTANVTEADVKAKLGDISPEVSLWPIASKEDGEQIRDFVEGRLKGSAMLKGAAFYQLVKTEDKIQDYKLIAIRDKDSGAIYCGPEARDLIGLPQYGDARVRPDTAGKWQVFVQSTSVNRKVSGGTQLMYWPNVGKAFTEGKSAR